MSDITYLMFCFFHILVIKAHNHSCWAFITRLNDCFVLSYSTLECLKRFPFRFCKVVTNSLYQHVVQILIQHLNIGFQSMFSVLWWQSICSFSDERDYVLYSHYVPRPRSTPMVARVYRRPWDHTVVGRCWTDYTKKCFLTFSKSNRGNIFFCSSAWLVYQQLRCSAFYVASSVYIYSVCQMRLNGCDFSLFFSPVHFFEVVLLIVL